MEAKGRSLKRGSILIVDVAVRIIKEGEFDTLLEIVELLKTGGRNDLVEVIESILIDQINRIDDCLRQFKGPKKLVA
jgi:hypothetical protein